jgi:prophage antirepressor-like protein
MRVKTVLEVYMSENSLVPYVFKEKQVRAVVKDGVPWLVAKDVCGVLGIRQPTRTVKNFPKDEVSAVSITHLSSNGVRQDREMLVVNEPGLYRLIFQSRKPEAEAFKRWIFHEVLPAIRNTGQYHIRGYGENTKLAVEACDRAYKLIQKYRYMDKPASRKDSVFLMEQAEAMRKAVYEGLTVTDKLVIRVDALERRAVLEERGAEAGSRQGMAGSVQAYAGANIFTEVRHGKESRQQANPPEGSNAVPERGAG